MQNTWLVLIPPLLVVILASTTRRVVLSLLAGIFSALLLVHNFSVLQAVSAMGKRMWVTTELGTVTSWDSFWQTGNLFICLFLLILGIIITMLRISGGAHSYANFVVRYLKNEKQAESSSLLLSLFFFIDDYFSCLTVGSVMQAVTDRYNIPRAKLALLVNSMAAPLVVILPVSSWVAEIMMQIRQSGVSLPIKLGTVIAADPFYLYLSIMPFIFYSFIIIAALWFIVLKKLSFGVMFKHEQIAHKTGNLFAGKIPAARRMKEISYAVILESSVCDFLIPIMTLFITVVAGVLYFGNYSLCGGTNSLLQAIQNTKIAPSLFSGALVTLVVSLGFLVLRRKLLVKQLPGLFVEGINLMWSSVFILILIWTLSSLLRSDLAVGHYLAQFLSGNINISLLPVMFFLTAVLMASTMGSAWGTLGILIPIGIPMLVSLVHVAVPTTLNQVPLLMPLLGAIISGAVVGNHLSPISDTMLMASTSSGAYHIDLVRMQFEVTLPCIFATACAFLVSGLLTGRCSALINVLTSLCIGIGVMIVIFQILHIRRPKKLV